MEFGIEHISAENLKKNATYNLTQSCYNLIITQETRNNVIINNRNVDLEPYSVLFYTSLTKIKLKENFSFQYVFFSDLFYCISEKDSSLIKQVLTMGHPSEGYVKIVIPKDYIDFSQFMVGELTQAKDKIPNPLVKDLIHLMLTQTFIYIFLELSKNQITPTAINSHERKLLWKFQELINERVQQQKNVSFYAETLSISPRRLAAITKKSLSKTPKEVITDGLIKKAKQKLFYTDSSIKEIAWELGFNDENNFSSLFHKKTGLTPTELRNSLVI
ncbi:helix-turn-helix domain-containing protein [Sphingobacterium sp. SGL-16]|uniref:helix-turn-helix domain-containing protein n=1 Tax=Sphingobacterium sp. SGL-16 TaxID=2710883 RepID=UPI0013EDB156|nr:AraC family transcriptional regulator [Sphingobacterium sp. SGL-16]NGM74209.1 helix-turn-helix domain-containing protein [Sphingobacterium sp. SGL-16]